MKLVQEIYNFKYQINQSLALITNDDQIITKMHLNFSMNIGIKFLDLAFCGMIIYVGGFSIGYFPMIHIFLSQQIFKQVQQFYQEIDKLRKFRNFLRNINNDYPLVVFNNLEGQEHDREDCAICKEVMTQARRLPCNHCFHWFCIIQLIESGSKNCPICRSEFNNNANRQQPQQNNLNNNPNPNRPGGNIFSFRLGGWLPNISVRMIRQRGPVIPYNQALERSKFLVNNCLIVREIFPYLST